MTATGTDAGKTHIGARLCSVAHHSGMTVMATKPVMSGFAAEQIARSDAGQVALAAGIPTTIAEIDRISPWRFEAALAPHHAAELEGIALEYDAILEFCRERLKLRCDFHLVEGAGGIMSPLTRGRLVLDLVADLEIPVLLVVPAYLGAVSHALTAISALSARGIRPEAVIVNNYGGNEDLAGYVWTDIAAFAPEQNLFNFPHDTCGGNGGESARQLLKILMQRPAGSMVAPAGAL